MVSQNLFRTSTQNKKRAPVTTRNKQYRVLIVDDDKTILGFLSLALSLDGYKCVRASNGQEAVQKVLAGEPSIIILDLAMPVMDGKDFYRWLRNSGHTEVPVILMTAGQNGMKTCQELGAQACLTKPFELAQLQSYMRKFIKNGKKP